MVERLDEETIKKMYELYRSGTTVVDIAKQLNIGESTVYKYLVAFQSQPLVSQATQPALQPVMQPMAQPTPQLSVQPVAQPERATVIETRTLTPASSLYPEMPEPDEWLRQFLDTYRLKEPFIQAQCARVKRRNQLPTPSDLMADLKEGDSGQKNTLMIRDIVEDYDYAVDEYMKQRDTVLQAPPYRRRGIPLNRPVLEPYRGGLPMQDPYYPREYGYPAPQRSYYDPYYYGRESIPYVPAPQQNPYPTLEQELERLARIQALLGKTEEKSPLTERYERDLQETKAKLEKLAEERQRELLDEMANVRQQYQMEQQRRRELEDKVRAHELQLAQKGLSETDLKFQELRDRQELEMRKLDEKSKTRDTIAKAVSSGFSQVGQAIFRTAQEIGSEETTEMQGVSDGRHMWQAPCPYCGTQITAPLSAKRVICPSCGKQLEMAEEQPTQTPLIPSQPIVKPVEPTQIVASTKPTTSNEWIVATCPYCNKPMRLPETARLIACPHCSRRLEVTPKTPPIEQQASFTVEQPLLPLEPTEREVFHTKPMEPEPPREPREPEAEPPEDLNVPIGPQPEDFKWSRKTREPEAKPPAQEEEFAQEEKQKIEQSIRDAKEGRITEMLLEEPKTEEPAEQPAPTKIVCEFCGQVFDRDRTDKRGKVITAEERYKGHRLAHLRWKHKKKNEKQP